MKRNFVLSVLSVATAGLLMTACGKDKVKAMADDKVAPPSGDKMQPDKMAPPSGDRMQGDKMQPDKM